jgi:hypothetical protein
VLVERMVFSYRSPMRRIAFIVSAALSFAVYAHAGSSPGVNGVFSKQRIVVNPQTGEALVPSGPNYVGTRSGTVYIPAGPNGVINSRNGRFAPVQ